MIAWIRGTPDESARIGSGVSDGASPSGPRMVTLFAVGGVMGAASTVPSVRRARRGDPHRDRVRCHRCYRGGHPWLAVNPGSLVSE